MATWCTTGDDNGRSVNEDDDNDDTAATDDDGSGIDDRIQLSAPESDLKC